MTQRAHRLRIAARFLVDFVVIGACVTTGKALTNSWLVGALMAALVVSYGLCCFVDGLTRRTARHY